MSHLRRRSAGEGHVGGDPDAPTVGAAAGGGAGPQVGDAQWVTNSVGLLEEQAWTGSRWVATGQVRNPLDTDGGGAGRTQFESERQLDIAQAQATLQNAQAALQNAQTSRDQLAIDRAQLDVQRAQLEFDKASDAARLGLDRDRLNQDIAATKQRLEEIRLEADLAFKNEDALLTKRLDAEREMLELRLDNDLRQLLFSEIGAERRALITEQGETRRLSAQLQGKDPFRQAALLSGQATRGRTPAQLFSQQNQAFLNQPLPQANIQAPIAQLQAQLTGAQNRPQQPMAPPVGLAKGGVIEMGRGSDGAFSMKPQSFLVGEGAGVIPGVTEVLTIGGGKVTVSPLMGGFQEGGTVITQPQLIRFSDSNVVYYWDANLGLYRDLTSLEVFRESGLDFADVVDLDPSERETTEFGPPITEAFDSTVGPVMPNLIKFEDEDTVYIWDADAQSFRSVGSLEIFRESGLSFQDVIELVPRIRERFSFAEEPLTEPFDETTDPRVEPPPPIEPPPVPSPQDIMAGLQALSPAFAGLTEFVPRTQTGPFGGTQAMRDFFSFGGQNLVQDPFSGAFRPFMPGLPEGVDPQALLNAPTSFGAPVVNQGAFNLQNLASLGFNPDLLRLGGQEDIFYRDPATGELRQFATPDIFEQSGFNPADVFNVSPTGQQFNFGQPITSPLPLPVETGNIAPFGAPLIDPFTGALLADPRKIAGTLQQLQMEQPSVFNNLLSVYGLAGLQPEAFTNRFQGAIPTGRLENPSRIGFLGGRL